MARPTDDLEALRLATRRLLAGIEDMSDEQAQEPCRLPDWNRAELLTHVARNADSVTRMVRGAIAGEVADQYPGGVDERAADIAVGHDTRAADLRYDVRTSADRMMEAWAELPADAWDRTARTISATRTMREIAWMRRREVEVHHIDLGRGYEPSDWPVSFVNRALAEIIDTFPQRASARRPLLDASFRLQSTDHDRAWRVDLRSTDVKAGPDDGSPVDGEARGWGCDLVAWLYGRDPRGGGVVASGDLGVLRLPQWFPYA